jgi:SAM-dependent methyltransferase
MPLVAIARALHEISEVLNDRRFGIRTAGWLPPQETGVPRADAHDYAATPYRVIRRLFREVPAQSFAGSFIDYGCGRGRMTVMAGSRPFTRVIGLELSEQLRSEALDNLRRSRVPRCCPVDVLGVDAAEFEVPDDVSAVYFYNPFGAVTMQAVLECIARSLDRRSRPLWVLAYNPPTLEQAAQATLRLSATVRGRTVYPTIEWAVYSGRSPRESSACLTAGRAVE